MSNSSDSDKSDSHKLFVNSESKNSKCLKCTSDHSINCNENKNDYNISLSSCNTGIEKNSKCSKSDKNSYDCSESDKNSIDCSEYEKNSIDCANDKLDICIHKSKKKNKDTYIISERKLINKMISNYYNPNSVCLNDNRGILKKSLPIYNNLISICLSFIQKVSKIKHNLNPTKSSKIFRLIYESYKTLFFNFHRSISSILNIKYKGCDVIDYTINNIESCSNNRINYASCNNFYESNNSLNNSTLFYSVPGLTILINNSTLSYRIIAKKSNINSNSKIFKYDFLLAPGSLSSCSKVNKKSFLKVLESISNFRNDNSNNILEFINFCHHESKSIKCLL